MSTESRHTNGSGGNGAGGFDDFGDFIRDREEEFTSEWDDPGAEDDPYADFGGSQRSSARPGIDRGLVDAITRMVDGLSGIAGEALAPELRTRVEQALRDLLVVLRDLITALIDRIDGRRSEEPRIEEIPID
jgi:hypothetical protein